MAANGWGRYMDQTVLSLRREIDGVSIGAQNQDTRLRDMQTAVALLDQGRTYASERVNAHSGRIQSIDERVQKMGARVGKMEDAMTFQSQALTRLEAVPAAVSKMQADMQSVHDRIKTLVEVLKWLGVLAMIGLGAWDKMPAPVQALFGVK
jgi:uncharacterized coiled-coil protein SlyX